MRSIFRTIALLTLLFGLTSCRMDSLYIQIPGTNWSIEQGNQRLMVHFGDERFASIQRNNETGGLQVTNGTYTTKGHSVAVTADHDGSIHKLVRTFSHLKNSSNKNFSSFWPEAPETMENTVWTTILIAGIFKEGIHYFRIITVFVTVWYLAFAFSFPDKWIASYDLSLPEPPGDLVYEVYPDAAPVLYEDGRFWEKYCRYMQSDYDTYKRKNVLELVREYNFSEDAAMKLIDKTS